MTGGSCFLTTKSTSISSYARRERVWAIGGGGLPLTGGAVAVEDQADRVGAFARRNWRRIAAAVRLQRVPDRPRVAGHPVRRLRDRLVATRCQDLQAARHLPQQQPLPGDLLLAVGLVRGPGRHRVADLVVNEDAAWRPHRSEGVILDFGAMRLPADHGGNDVGLLAGDEPRDVEAVATEVQQRAAAGLRLLGHPRRVPFDIAPHGWADPAIDDVRNPAELAGCDHALNGQRPERVPDHERDR